MDFFLVFVFVGFVVIIVLIYKSGCPKCDHLFARKKVAEKTLRKSGWFSLGERLITYRCNDCGHVWKEKETDRMDYP